MCYVKVTTVVVVVVVVIGVLQNCCVESSSLDCAAGTYGSGCAETCNERCAGDNNPCDQSDGACSRGCDPGYVGTHCENVVLKEPLEIYLLDYRIWAIATTVTTALALVAVAVLLWKNYKAPSDGSHVSANNHMYDNGVVELAHQIDNLDGSSSGKESRDRTEAGAARRSQYSEPTTGSDHFGDHVYSDTALYSSPREFSRNSGTYELPLPVVICGESGESSTQEDINGAAYVCIGDETNTYINS